MNKELLNKLRAVAASAESVADDYEKGRLWEGDLLRRLSGIRSDLERAQAMAQREDR